MSTFPQCVAFFEANRRTKRNYNSSEQNYVSNVLSQGIGQIYASQIIGSNSNKMNKQAGSMQLVSMGMGQKEQFVFGLNKNGQVFIWGEFSVPIPQEDQNTLNLSLMEPKCVKQLYQNTPLQIQYEGTLYAWGDDSELKHGLLGLGSQHKALRPCPNSYLFDYMVKSVSMSEQHVCAVDSNGRLFTWGYGPNGELGLDQQVQQTAIPTIVTKQKQINIKKAICHTNYTAFCSGAGYAYFFGSLMSQQEKIRQSSSKFSVLPHTTLQKSNSQMTIENRQNNLLGKSSSRPLNSMTQIISLSENFISDLLGGDSFMLALTSNADVFFVDDSLESVQINSQPIEQLAILGTKILGLASITPSQEQSIYEWSTAGLNKLSFNKENKLLLKQDFQIREFKLKPEFSSNPRLCNLTMTKFSAALIFDDIGSMENKFQSQLLSSHQENYDENEPRLTEIKSKLVIAAYSLQGVKQSQFNPLMMMTDSSVNSSREEKDLSMAFQSSEKASPAASLSKSRCLTEGKSEVEALQPSHLQGENIFNYHSNQAPHHKQPSFAYQPFQQNNQVPPNQFFFDCDQQTVNPNQLYRPSSIKSYKQSQNNSSPSLKQCAVDMMPLGRNSKIEISFPSFLNMSGGGAADNRNSIPSQQVDKFSIKMNNVPMESDSEIKEESMTVTFDSFKIKAKKTTTPRRLLNGYSMNKRSTPSEINNPLSSSKSQLSSQQSELSNGFNLTTQSCRTKEGFNAQPVQSNKKVDSAVQKKLSNSCGAHSRSKKRQSFIKAILEQSKPRQHFDIADNQTSVTQQYIAPPFKNKKEDVQDHISEVDSSEHMQQHQPGVTEIEYSVSNSCTPTSNQSSDVKRRINFDEASGGVMRMSETTTNNKLFAQFKLTINNQTKSPSFMFNQCQSPPPVQPFNDENPMSNIKSTSTPSMHDNGTHMLMMTEEKFKNLKSEISLNDQQTQFLITQNTLLSSPLLHNDYNIRSTSNLQNLSGFIKQNKYLQVYENFRRAFMSLCKFKDQRMALALRKIKKVTNDQKQRKEFMQGMARFLLNTLKSHVQMNQQVGFKKIKKFYKEKQLQVYIRRKQNEFAMKTAVLVKIDTLIQRQNAEGVKDSFSMIKKHFEQIKKGRRDREKKGATMLFAFLSRKHKHLQEKSLRSIVNLATERKISEMQFKMLQRVLVKVVSRRLKASYHDLVKGIDIKEKRTLALSYMQRQTLRQKFKQFKQQTQNKNQKLQAVLLLDKLYSFYKNKVQMLYALQTIQKNSIKIQASQDLFQMINKLLKKGAIGKMKANYKEKVAKQKSEKVNRALVLLLCSKLGDIVKSKLRFGFKQLNNYQRQDETMMIQKSLTSGNLSFSLNSLGNDPSMILTRNKQNNQGYYSIEGGQKKKFSLKPAANPMGKSYNQFQQNKKGFIIAKPSKPTLNDYLSFSPKNFEQLPTKELNKFQVRRKTEATNSARPLNQHKFDKAYLDCPLPQKQGMNKENEARSRNANQNNLKQQTSKLNVSIKDLNAAFRNEISRIKEKQDDSLLDSLESDQNDQVIQMRGGSPKINPLCTSESQLQHLRFSSLNPSLNVSQVATFKPVPLQLDLNAHQPSQQSLDSMPKTSTFGQIKDQDENVSESAEGKFSNQPLTFREQNHSNQHQLQLFQQAAKGSQGFVQSTSQRKKSDSRYQRLSCLEQDFSMDFDQSHNMFDEFEAEEKEQQIIRLQCTNNIGMSMAKTSLADLSRKLDLTSILAEDQTNNFLYSHHEQTSPKFSESFIPGFNREVLHELAANFQMMELTPEADIQMLLNNKSICNREESIYSNNQYADPVEMVLSPRQIQQLELRQKYLFPLYTQFQTNSSQVNYCQTMSQNNFPLSKEVNSSTSSYEDTEHEEEEDDLDEADHDSEDCEERLYKQQNWEFQKLKGQASQNNLGKPYDFELSSNSKYKIISENEKIKHILRSEIAQPGMINNSQANICKKLSFGNEARANMFGTQAYQSAGIYTTRAQSQQRYNAGQQTQQQQYRSLNSQHVRNKQYDLNFGSVTNQK